MNCIHDNIFVGNQEDYEQKVKGKKNWAVVQACKEPYHRQALGYTGRAAEKTHPEYLFAERNNRLILNLVDVDNHDWISPIIIDKAMEYIDEKRKEGMKILIHCNQGLSRSAGIGLLYLRHIGFFDKLTFEEAEKAFIKLYPNYNPANGIKTFVEMNWEKYKHEKSGKKSEKK